MSILNILREQQPLNEAAKQLATSETFVGLINCISFEENISKKEAFSLVISECEHLGISPPIKTYESLIVTACKLK